MFISRRKLFNKRLDIDQTWPSSTEIADHTEDPMSTDQNTQDLLEIINLLAGAAQAGATGILAQAALNVMRASEAVVKARKFSLSAEIQKAAETALQQAQETLFQATQIPDAMDEAKQDIMKYNHKSYTPG